MRPPHLRQRPPMTTLPVVRIERIMLRALRVHQRAANKGHERAATATRDAEQIQQQVTFGLVTGMRAVS